jgi:hypothetical protein
MSQTTVGKARASKPPSPWKPARPVKKLNNPNAVLSLNGRWGFLFTAPFFVMFLIFGLAPRELDFIEITQNLSTTQVVLE